MQVKDIVSALEKIAPVYYQESYDNAGLIIGHPDDEVSKIILALDVTEAVIDEAIAQSCSLIVAHHPLIFKGLKKINGGNETERCIVKAIQNKIAIYAAHTNLDNVLNRGVNSKFASKLGLKHLRILQPTQGNLSKLVVYCPASSLEIIKATLFENGAGRIGLYSECSFSFQGTGSFKPADAANPHTGTAGKTELVEEMRVEVLASSAEAAKLIQLLRGVHPYEEMAYEIIPLSNLNQEIGAGTIGELDKPMETKEFLDFLKKSLHLNVIKHTAFKGPIKRVALCGGAGSFLLSVAKREKADAFISSDIKYHEFFEAREHLLYCDIGHYESEISTLELFFEVIQENFPNFAVIFCKTNTNPIQYHS